jgi:hypothetical protein
MEYVIIILLRYNVRESESIKWSRLSTEEYVMDHLNSRHQHQSHVLGTYGNVWIMQLHAYLSNRLRFVLRYVGIGMLKPI